MVNNKYHDKNPMLFAFRVNPFATIFLENGTIVIKFNFFSN